MIPTRTCIGCKTRRGQGELLRLVCAAGGEVMVDWKGRAPGRGVYVCCDARCFRNAFRPSRLNPIFRRPAIAPALDAVVGATVSSLRERLGTWLSIAQRAGGLVSGHTSVRRACGRSKVVYMIVAEDSAVQRAAEYRVWCAEQNIPYVMLFTKEELGRRIGKSSRSAVGLLNPRFRDSFCGTLTQLQTFEASLHCLDIQGGRMPQLKQVLEC